MKQARPYQLDALDRMERALITDDRSNTLLSLPPSGGKTFTALTFSQEHFLEKGDQVLWVAHRKELLDQAYEDALIQCPGNDVAIWTGKEKQLDADLLIASVGSRSLLTYDYKPRFLIIDECHHGAADSYSLLMDVLEHEKRLGLSGTPFRTDKRAFGFDHIAYQIPFRELVRQRYCAKPIYVRFRTRQQYEMSLQRGDFAAASLKALNNIPRNRLVAKEFFTHPEYWPALVYACNIDHAESLLKVFEKYSDKHGIPVRVKLVTGKTPKGERKETVEAFRRGEVDALINVACFTEGTDLPNARAVLLARPTISEVLYMQMALRGGRIAPGKDHFYIVDFVDSVGHYIRAARDYSLEHLIDEPPPEYPVGQGGGTRDGLKFEDRELVRTLWGETQSAPLVAPKTQRYDNCTFRWSEG